MPRFPSFTLLSNILQYYAYLVFTVKCLAEVGTFRLLIPVESINLYLLWSDGWNLILLDNLKEQFIKSCKKSYPSRQVIKEIQVTPSIVMHFCFRLKVFIVDIEFKPSHTKVSPSR